MSSEIERLHITITARTTEFMRGMDAVTAKMTNVGRQMAQVGASLTRYVTLPIVAVGGAAFKTAMDFEYSMAKIEALVGVSREQLDAWSEDMRRIGLEFGKMPGELADALYFITSAGLRGAEAMEVLEISAKGSASGLGAVKDIASLLTFVINAYGKENITAARAADILTAAIREGSLEADQLARAMGTLLPTASALGISFETLAASYAIMSRTGSDVNEITTTLNGIMSALLNTSPQVTKMLEGVGLSMADLRDVASSGPDGLIQVFRMLNDAFEGNDEALRQIFPNIRAFRGLMSMLAQDADSVDEVIRAVTASMGILDGAWATMSETSKQAWEEMKAGIAWGLKELGDVLLPLVAEKMGIVTGRVIELAENFAALDKAQQDNIIKWAAYTAAAGPVLSVLGNLTISIAGIAVAIKSVVIPAFILLGKIALAVVTGIAAAIGAPVAVVIAALMAIVTAIILVIRNIERMRQAWRDAMSEMSSGSGAGGGMVTSPGMWFPGGRSGGGGARGGEISPSMAQSFFRGFHSGGMFHAPKLGGEGFALLKDRERVIPAGVDGEGGATTINMTINQNITDKSTADYAANKIAKVFQQRGIVGAYR